jgi:sirohydrochlorin ferrochelatase
VKHWSGLFSLALCAALVASFPGRLRADSEIGVLIMAEAGPRVWTKTVNKTVKNANLSYPTRVFFGPADSAVQQGTLQDDIRDLEDSGVHTVVVVPLIISPYHQAYKQWKYLLGLDIQAGYNTTPLFPIDKHSTIRFAEPLNDSAVVVEILLDRIQEISRKPAEESVVIVTAGARDKGDNNQWLETLKRLCARLKDRGGFKSVVAVTLRDDATSQEREQALLAFRHAVQGIQQNGDRALVVPLMLSEGGIEHKISLELRGVAYTYNNKPLLPDTRMSEWIRSQLPE